ncbi:MAG TPA: methylated-DNA--[protein]-cysteine S-methyltransferase [Burkholderiales bacterium]|jgi:methylated-DNA-[protein]-cysteine S-methyltransferase|nr:methylated-DNA--[protein]-cysteine S-methyltransferase [Burkholderiales bacterium]
MLEVYQARYPTPFAVLGIRSGSGLLHGIDYLPRGAATLDPLEPLAAKVCRQIERYLDDPEFRFSVPFEFKGTRFQCRVWREIAAIPSGETLTYAAVARKLRTAPRPVGGACGANRIPLVIPCHRVVAAGGLGGFMNASRGSPLEIKKWLLGHEGVRFGPH